MYKTNNFCASIFKKCFPQKNQTSVDAEKIRKFIFLLAEPGKVKQLLQWLMSPKTPSYRHQKTGLEGQIKTRLKTLQ